MLAYVAASASAISFRHFRVQARRCLTTAAKQNEFRLALCQFTVGTDKTANLKVAERNINDAVSKGADIVTLPECFNSPYATDQFPIYAEEIPDDLDLLEAETSPSTAMLRDSAKRHGVYIIGGSIPERSNTSVFNTCVVIGPDGSLLAKHRKVHLFDIDIPGKQTFRESDTLTAGNQVTVFDTPFCKIGVAICYDIRFPELADKMRKEGAELLVYPGAFNTTTGPMHWELLARGRAVDNQLYVACVSPSRNPDSTYQAWGHSSLVDPWGNVAATCDHSDAVLVETVDLAKVRDFRQSVPTSLQKRFDLY